MMILSSIINDYSFWPVFQDILNLHPGMNTVKETTRRSTRVSHKLLFFDGYPVNFNQESRWIKLGLRESIRAGHHALHLFLEAFHGLSLGIHYPALNWSKLKQGEEDLGKPPPCAPGPQLWSLTWLVSNTFLNKRYEIGVLLPPMGWCCESAAHNMPANLENSAVATGLEKVSFHSNPKERQCQRMLKLLHNCTHLTH